MTPLAFGGYGLVLPRYPGARVLLADAGGGGRDVVDLGGVWESGARAAGRAGDWWLVLPIGVAADDLPADSGRRSRRPAVRPATTSSTRTAGG